MPTSRKKSTITRLREKRSLSQYALAKKVGIAQSHLQGIERGETEPRIRLAMRLAEALGVSVRELWPEKAA
jgi:putative transcriptional regulator